MGRPRGRPPCLCERNGPEEAPAGAALDRYEASMMLMIACRVIEAYRERDRTRKAIKPTPSRMEPR